jgi:hypothetical protein
MQVARVQYLKQMSDRCSNNLLRPTRVYFSVEREQATVAMQSLF